MLQTTLATITSKRRPQTVFQTPSSSTSRRPSSELDPPTSLTEMEQNKTSYSRCDKHHSLLSLLHRKSASPLPISTLESADRESQRFDILSVKKGANLSAREVGEVEVGKGDADLR